MRKKQNPFIKNDDSIAYVPGVGFVSSSPEEESLGQLRLKSNLIAGCFLLYFLAQRLLAFPITMLFRICGAAILINPYTGMITASAEIRPFLPLFARLLCTALLFLLFHCLFAAELRLDRPARTERRVDVRPAIPLSVAAGAFGYLAAWGLLWLFRCGGIVLPTFPAPIASPDALTLLRFLVEAGTNLLRIVLFLYFLLPVLRQFGDGFAIVACALLAAATSDSVFSMIAVFPFLLAAGYFSIYTGRRYPVLIARLLLDLLFWMIRIGYGVLDTSLCTVLSLVLAFFLLVWCISSYLLFLQREPQAFFLQRPPHSLTNRRKLTTYCTSICFLLLLLRLALTLFSNIQYIG